MSRVDEIQRAVLQTIPSWGRHELWLRVLFEKQLTQTNKPKEGGRSNERFDL